MAAVREFHYDDPQDEDDERSKDAQILPLPASSAASDVPKDNGFSIRDRLRYRFDDFMSRGSSSSFVALTVVFLGLFVTVAVGRAITVAALGDPDVERGNSFWRQIWIAFLEMTDPGSMAQDIDSAMSVKIFAVIAGLAGLVLLSALIAVITTALDGRLAALRKGHSKVVLEEHSVILGWNERIVDVLRELILANESEESAAVVILADKDKEEMDDFLALNLPERITTKIVTRSGEISSLVNLGVVSINTCRSVIVLSSVENGPTSDDFERSDMTVIKTILGVRGALDDGDVPVVAEIFSQQKRELARTIDPGRVVAIDADDMLAKILVQTSRNEGLAVVYEEMLSFDGAEIYLYEPDLEFTGQTLREASFCVPDGVPLGFVDSDGEVRLNPPSQTRLEGRLTLVVLSSDDSAIEVVDTPVATPVSVAPSSIAAEQSLERELIIGWTSKLPTIIREYGDYVVEGSAIDIVLREPNPARAVELVELAKEVPGLELRLLDANPRNAADLLTLRPFEYNNIIVLSEAGQAGAAEWADSETLVFLLQLQQIFQEHGETSTKLVAEILESRNRELITGTGVREFVISNRLVSMVMSQISEQQEMASIYENLFSEAGSEVYLKPLDFYVGGDMPESLTFADVMEACFKRDELAIGLRYSTGAEDPGANFGVELIPDKLTRVATSDILSVVVLAEDEA